MPEKALYVALGRVGFVWPEGDSSFKFGPIVDAEGRPVAEATYLPFFLGDGAIMELPEDLPFEDEAFERFCREFVGAPPIRRVLVTIANDLPVGVDELAGDRRAGAMVSNSQDLAVADLAIITDGSEARVEKYRHDRPDRVQVKVATVRKARNA